MRFSKVRSSFRTYMLEEEYVLVMNVLWHKHNYEFTSKYNERRLSKIQNCLEKQFFNHYFSLFLSLLILIYFFLFFLNTQIHTYTHTHTHIPPLHTHTPHTHTRRDIWANLLWVWAVCIKTKRWNISIFTSPHSWKDSTSTYIHIRTYIS